MSWGSPNKDEKFYKGAKNDTAWNKDLLWRYHVAKETKQSKINTGEIPCPDPTLKMRHMRMKMGITGTLIPDITPRYDEVASMEPRGLQSSSSRRQLGMIPPDADEIKSIVSKACSVRSSMSQKSSTSSSVLSCSSSTRSLRLEDVRQLVDNQSRLLKESTQDELVAMRQALQDEAHKRQLAEKKLLQLCAKLGLEDK